ncbi:hypothetical protein SK128_008199, partial [Halocaridina rubra]
MSPEELASAAPPPPPPPPPHRLTTTTLPSLRGLPTPTTPSPLTLTSCSPFPPSTLGCWRLFTTNTWLAPGRSWMWRKKKEDECLWRAVMEEGEG